MKTVWNNKQFGSEESKPSLAFLPYSILLIAIAFLMGCGSSSPSTDTSLPAPNAIQLSDLDITSGQTIYIPANSELYIMDDRRIDLAVNLVIHNTDLEHSIFLTSVRYYDSQGQLIRDYLSEPRELTPLASTDFFVAGSVDSGGIGTNFIVEWVAEEPVFEPVVEAIMLNTSNNQGISLTSPGRVVRQITPPEE